MANFAKIDENNTVLAILHLDNDIVTDENGVEQESLGQAHLEQHNNWPANQWITIREASELTGRQPRTIRYHSQKFRDSKPSLKKLNDCINYISGDYDQSILMINEAFIFELYPSVKKRVAKGGAKGMQNDNAKGGEIAMQQTQPNVNEIEDLVQRRLKVMTEAHNREIENLKSAHADYLERLDKGAINMMNMHESEITRLQQSNKQQIKQLRS